MPENETPAVTPTAPVAPTPDVKAPVSYVAQKKKQTAKLADLQAALQKK